MERPPAMTLTDAAVARIKALLDAADKPVIGIRVGVKAQGCSGMSYHVEYAEKELPFEEVVEDQGVCVLIDPAATMFLLEFRARRITFCREQLIDPVVQLAEQIAIDRVW